MSNGLSSLLLLSQTALNKRYCMRYPLNVQLILFHSHSLGFPIVVSLPYGAIAPSALCPLSGLIAQAALRPLLPVQRALTPSSQGLAPPLPVSNAPLMEDKCCFRTATPTLRRTCPEYPLVVKSPEFAYSRTSADGPAREQGVTGSVSAV